MGLLKIIKFLLERGCPLQREDTLISAVYEAAKPCQHEALDIILSMRADDARKAIDKDEECYYDSTFHRVVKNKDLASLKLLLQYGCMVMSDRDAWWTFQGSSSTKKLKKKLETLLTGIYPHVTNVMHWSPSLHMSFPKSVRESINWVWGRRSIIIGRRDLDQNQSISSETLPDEVWHHVHPAI